MRDTARRLAKKDWDEMARRTRRENEQTVETFYGINPTTFKVEEVFLNRGGVLQKYGADAIAGTHLILPGQRAKTEIFVVWGLTNLISFSQGMSDVEYAKKQIAQLEEKAAEMKKTAEEKK